MNINLSRYNCILFFLYLFLAAYNIFFYITYKDDQCKDTVAVATRVIEQLEFDFLPQENQEETRNIEAKLMNISSDNHKREPPKILQNASSTVSNITQQFQTLISSVQLSKVPLGLGIIYIILASLSMLAAFAINWFSHMLPEKFSSLGFFKGAVGCFIRNNPKLLRISHYVLILMIIIQFILIFGNASCQNAQHISGTTITTGEMYDNAIIYNIVTLCFWGAMFIGFPFIKAMLPQEAFIFEPYDSDIGIIRYVMCTFLGPN